MAREFSRAERVADFIKREMAILLQQSLRDPRAANANVNDVVVSSDLSQAKVYVTFLDKQDEAELEEAVEVLNNAAGFLRSELARQHTMRSTPRLRFYYDSSVREGARLSQLIETAVAGQAGKQSGTDT